MSGLVTRANAPVYMRERGARGRGGCGHTNALVDFQQNKKRREPRETMSRSVTTKPTKHSNKHSSCAVKTDHGGKSTREGVRSGVE